jgi:hypothetical protein
MTTDPHAEHEPAPAHTPAAHAPSRRRSQHSWLEIGNFSWGALTALGTLGLWYVGFHTLAPIVENQNLTQKNAELEIEIRDNTAKLTEKQKQFQETSASLTRASDELKRLESSLEAIRAENAQLQTANVELVKGINAQNAERSKLTDLVAGEVQERQRLEQQNGQIQSERDATLRRMQIGDRNFVLGLLVKKVRGELSEYHAYWTFYPGLSIKEDPEERKRYADLPKNAHDLIVSHYKSEDLSLLDQETAARLESDIDTYMRDNSDVFMDQLTHGDKKLSQQEAEAESYRRDELISKIKVALTDMNDKLILH